MGWRLTKRRSGYLIWGIAGLVIAIPEITAAFDKGALPFTTISAMVGHIERHWNLFELIVVAAIVFLIFSTVRVPPPRPEQGASDDGEEAAEEPAPESALVEKPRRTAGGRITVLPPPPSEVAPANFDEQGVPGIFVAAAIVSFAAITGATLATIAWWDDGKPHYHPAYVLYGLIGLLWLLIPSVAAFLWTTDVPFPTMFRTVSNLEDWFRSKPWSIRSRPIGPMLAWLLSYLIFWGLVVLLLHLALYPYPDITHILNPKG
jgi:hypothetical protein